MFELIQKVKISMKKLKFYHGWSKVSGKDKQFTFIEEINKLDFYENNIFY